MPRRVGILWGNRSATTCLLLVLTLLALFPVTACKRSSLHSLLPIDSSLRVTGSAVLSEVSPPADLDEAIWQAIEELATRPAPPGVDTMVFSELKERLADLLRQRLQGGLRLTSSEWDEGPPYTDLRIDGSSATGTVSLAWRYRLVGDYNQDGIVNIDDIDELARYFNVDVTKHPEAEPVDGNGDTVISIADITPLAMHFNESVGYFSIEGAGELGGVFESVARFDVVDGRLPGWRRYDFRLPEERSGYWRLIVHDVHTRSIQGTIASDTFDVGTGQTVSGVPLVGNILPIRAFAGNTVQFSAGVSGTEPVSYYWNFGDAAEPSTSSDAEPEVSVTAVPGRYEVSLTVSSPLGIHSSTFQVELYAPLAEGDWSRQGVQSTTSEEGLSDFSLSPLTAEPVIASWDPETRETILLRRVDGAWNRDTVFGSDVQPLLIRLQLDRQGRALVAGVVKLARKNLSLYELRLWLESPPDGSDGIYRLKLPSGNVSLALALAPNGSPGVAYTVGQSVLYLAELLRSKWQRETVWSGQVRLERRALAFDNWGRPTVVFVEGDYAPPASDARTLMAFRDESGWQYEWIVKAGGAAPVGIEFDNNGTPFICYTRPYRRIEVASRGAFGYWKAKGFDAYPYSVDDLAFTLTPDGSPAIVYLWEGLDFSDRLVFAWENAEDWHQEIARTIPTQAPRYRDLRIQASGNRIAFTVAESGLHYYERSNPLP